MAFSDAWSDVIRANWATCQLFIDLRKGDYRDLSSNARAVTLTNGAPVPDWHTPTAGKGINTGIAPATSAALSTPNAAVLNLQPSGTIAMFFRAPAVLPAALSAAYVVKRAIGVTCAYQFYTPVGGGGLLRLFDGVTDHVMGAASWVRTRSLVAAFTAGAVPRCYENGVLLVPPATLWAPVAGDASVLYLCNSAARANGAQYDWLCFFLFSAQLSGAEIAQLHADFLQSCFVL